MSGAAVLDRDDDIAIVLCEEDVDPRHVLEVVERGRLAGACLNEPELGPFRRARKRVEQVGDVAWIGLRLVERVRDQRTCERAFLNVRLLRESRELGGVGFVERDVEAEGHPLGCKRNSTTCACSG